MGIIVFIVVIFLLFGIGGIELFVVEVFGLIFDKFYFCIWEMAKWLWQIYVGLIGFLCIVLLIVGFDFYEVINYVFIMMVIGGFFIKNVSMVYYDLLQV